MDFLGAEGKRKCLTESHKRAGKIRKSHNPSNIKSSSRIRKGQRLNFQNRLVSLRATPFLRGNLSQASESRCINQETKFGGHILTGFHYEIFCLRLNMSSTVLFGVFRVLTRRLMKSLRFMSFIHSK